MLNDSFTPTNCLRQSLPIAVCTISSITPHFHSNTSWRGSSLLLLSASFYSQRLSLYKATKYKIGFFNFALRMVKSEKCQTLAFFPEILRKWEATKIKLAYCSLNWYKHTPSLSPTPAGQGDTCGFKLSILMYRWHPGYQTNKIERGYTGVKTSNICTTELRVDWYMLVLKMPTL